MPWPAGLPSPVKPPPPVEPPALIEPPRPAEPGGRLLDSAACWASERRGRPGTSESKTVSEESVQGAEVVGCGKAAESEQASAVEGLASKAGPDVVPCSRTRLSGTVDASREETALHVLRMGYTACRMESRACQPPGSAAEPGGSRHWRRDSYGYSGSTWVGAGRGEYTNAADANTAAAACLHCLCAAPVRNPYLPALYLHPFHQHLLAWAAQPADDDSSCRLGVHEAAAKSTTASGVHWVATRF